MADKDTQTESEIQFTIGCSPVCDIVRKPKRRKRKSRPWHRMLGMISALPLIWVLITGVLLNHQEDFGLTETEITSPLVLSAYGMTPAGEPMSVTCDGKVITYWDNQVFFQESSIEVSGNFIGAVADGEGVVIICDDSVTRLDANGDLIEKLDELSLPSLPLFAVASHAGTVFLKNTEGWHSPDADWLEFTAKADANPTATELSPLDNDKLKKSISASWAGGGLPLSRIVLDLHAGNFLGDFAKYFYDFVVFCTLWLIGTGLVLQYRTSRRSKPTS